jgi:dethiobiotin synthase
MNRLFPEKLFVTGTDTGVGKTLISTILVAGLNASYWKPIQSGIEEPGDTEFVKKISKTTGQIFPEAYRLSQPVSPHASAANDGITIDLDLINLPQCRGHLIVEGAGGVFVPLNDEQYVIDLIKKLALPVLVVAHNRLGTINHTLLTINALRQRGCDIWGVVLNGPENRVNRQAVVKYGKVKIVAEIERLARFDQQTLHDAFTSWFT